MSDQMKRQVLSLLNNYTDISRKISALRYELEHPAHVTPQEMLEVMNFHHTDATGGASGSGKSDKTCSVALGFRDRADAANGEIVQDIIKDLCRMEQERDRLLHFLSLLEDRERAVLRMSYIEHKKAIEIGEALGVSDRTVLTIKNRGIDRLCELYRLTEPIRG